jgi:hypothetical protein
MAYAPERSPESDWAKQTTDTIERVVGAVRAKTTGPLIKVARAVVYGTLAAIVGIAAIVLLAIVAVRVLDLLPGGVWVAHLITGSVFSLAGLLLWRKRTAAAA